ncbi:MAG: HDIG domain-containing protein [Firmicutes bacterium]|nr:HDIG domain-containing protein [Bacillota bacterium]
MEFLWVLNAYLQSRGEAWVVGGALRDRLLGFPINEIDLVLNFSPKHLPASLWQKAGAKTFWLDQERQILRAIFPAGQTLDFGPLQGQNILADLAGRDFTVNAMAQTLSDWLQGQDALVDPWHGQGDLAARRLRLVSTEALRDDPIRVLRGVRLMLEKGLSIDRATAAAMEETAPLLAHSPAERIMAELSLIFLHARAPAGLAYLDQIEVTRSLFPEVIAMNQVTQNKYHQFTVGEHSHRAFAAFVSIVHAGRYLPIKAQAWFRDYWLQLTPPQQVAAMLAAWLHDIGKPVTRAVRQGRVAFYDHETVGAKMARDIAQRLKLSSAQTDLLAAVVRLHMYPMQLWRTGKLGPRLIHRFYQRAGQYGPLIVVFTLADHLAKGENVAVSEEFAAHREMVVTFLEAYFCHYDEVVKPKPLLDGHAMQGIAQRGAGPWLRQARQQLLEAQVAGKVQTQEQAIAWFQQWLQANPLHAHAGIKKHSPHK